MVKNRIMADIFFYIRYTSLTLSNKSINKASYF